MKRDTVKNWFINVFTRDINLPRTTLIYLFFSLVAIMFVAGAFLFKYTMESGLSVGEKVGIEIYVFLLTLAISFIVSGVIIDKIKNRTKYFNIVLLICVIGLFITSVPNLIIYYLGLLLILLTIPQLIIVWFTILVHETNILNRGRITTLPNIRSIPNSDLQHRWRDACMTEFLEKREFRTGNGRCSFAKKANTICDR